MLRDNIGLVWRKIYTSKQCHFEDGNHHAFKIDFLLFSTMLYEVPRTFVTAWEMHSNCDIVGTHHYACAGRYVCIAFCGSQLKACVRSG